MESEVPPIPARAPLTNTAAQRTRLTRIPAAASASGCSPAKLTHSPVGVYFIQRKQIATSPQFWCALAAD